MAQALNILLLADDRHPANSIQDHVQAYRRYSRHHWVVLNPIYNRICPLLDFKRFDAVAIHYSLCVVYDYYLPPRVRQKIRDFKGPKFQFIQDEYRWVDRTSAVVADLGIDTLFTLVRQDLVERAYSDPRLKHVRKVSVLPGYVPEDLVRYPAGPIVDRRLHIAYRGRRLPYWLGALAQDKVRIAEGVSARAARHGLCIDVSADEEDRIYGPRWIGFICSAKAVLGTEGGASIWDFQSQAQRAVEGYLETHPEADFEEVSGAVLRPFESNLMYNTISPRLFEAAALRTAMVMFPGWYNGVVEPHDHYIPLEKDFSNIAEVADKLHDDAFLQRMVDRTFDDIVRSQRYSKRAFIEAIDRFIEESAGAWRPVDLHESFRGAGSRVNIESQIRLVMALERWFAGPVAIGLRGTEFLHKLREVLFDPRFPRAENRRRARRLLGRAIRLAVQEIAWVYPRLRMRAVRDRVLKILKRVYGRYPVIWPAWRALRGPWRRVRGHSAVASE